jgi:hemolysin III
MQHTPVDLEALPGAQDPLEEVANSISHGLGAAFSIAGLVLLVVWASLGGDPWRIVAVSVYGASLVILFSASTLYHAVRNPRLKRIFWVLDHASIYLLIAGTYTPFTLVTLRGGWGWSIFGVQWGLALLGILYKLFFIGRYPAVSVALYIVMGWVGVIAVWPILQALPLAGVGLVALGGVLYTAGVVFFRWFSLRFHHLWWHLFVLAGAAVHWVAVGWYVVPGP